MINCKLNIPKFGVILVAVLACIFFIFSIDEYYFPVNEHHHYIYINVSKKVCETDDRFLSVGLDTSFMRETFDKLNFSDLGLLAKYARHLEPAYLRLGGTAADQVIFQLNDTVSAMKDELLKSPAYDHGDENPSPKDYLYISGREWLKFNTFVKNSRLNLLFDLNALTRNGSSWDSSNAQSLLTFSEKNDLKMDFQLGNEPNSFRHVFNMSISATQLGVDYETLHEILSSTTGFNNSKLIGPEVTRPKNLEEPSLEYLKEFLTSAKNLNAISWHQYYFNGRTAKLEQFLDPNVFNVLSQQIMAVTDTVRQFSSSIPIWLTETSSAYGGGAPGLSDRFVASFLWLDKLGLAAKMGIKVVVRQSLFQGHYSLIDENLYPLPDYWISLFYKLLVGKTVLDVRLISPKEENHLRFYGHCLKKNTLVDGNVVLFGMNLGNASEYLIPGGLLTHYPVTPLIFTAGNNSLLSKSVLLNGKPLQFYIDKNIYKEYYFKTSSQKMPLDIPPRSIAFWIFHGKKQGVCSLD